MGKKQANKNKNIHRPSIGFIIDGTFDPYQTTIWKGILDEAKNNDINLYCYVTGSLRPSIGQRNNAIDLINTEKLDGIILPSSSLINGYSNKQDFVDILKRFDSVKIVSIGVEISGTPSILVDNESGMRELMLHLVKSHGFRRIAMIRGPKDNPEAQLRFKAYKNVLEECDLPVDGKLIAQGGFKITLGPVVKIISSLLDERKVTFDALVCCNDFVALNAIRELNRRGIRVPEDIAVVGFDDTEAGRYFLPPLTTVNQPVYKLGQEAIRFLLRSFNNEKIENRIIIPTSLVIRRSCRCFEDMNMKTTFKEKKLKINLSDKKHYQEIILSEITKNPVINHIWPDDYQEKSELFMMLIKTVLFKDKKKSGNEFLLKLEAKIIEYSKKGISVLSWNKIISAAFNILKKYINNDADFDYFNGLWRESGVTIGNIAEHLNLYSKIQYKDLGFHLYNISSYLISIFDLEDLKDMIIKNFPNLGIKSCYISFYENEKRVHSRLFMGYDKDQNAVYNGNYKKFISKNLVPANINLDYKRHSYLIELLVYEDTQVGFMVFETEYTEDVFFDTLAIQLSNALRGIDLMNRIKKHSRELENKVMERTVKLENANKSIEEANVKLKQLDSLKNDFIANITHDFRSPLTSILNIADLALRFNGNIDEENKENYNIIYKSSLRLKSAIDKLLDLARMDAQGIKLKIKKTDPATFMRQILDFYSSSVVGSGIKIIKNLPENEIENFYTDIEKLEEIVDNIISNAIKFVDHQTGIINIELSDYSDKILIVISDNGPGIPKDKLFSIFNRFEQAHEGRNSSYRGTGIGLAFARQLIEYLKGRVWAESEGDGTGAKFFIELKKGIDIFEEKDFSIEDSKLGKREDLRKIIESEIETKLQDENLQILFTDLNGENELEIRKSRILIVDDDNNIRNIVMRYLKNTGYKNFIVASNGKQGLDAVYEYSPDLIICDFNMPKMRGDEFHNRLLENPKFGEIPFIFLSAVADENLIIERRQKGASAYLKKPIDEKIFLITVEEQIKKYFEFLKVRQLAAVDELTGLYNRRTIISSLNHELSIRRYRDLSIIFFDIDHFKEINDTYGHLAGDLVLSKTGELIKSSVRNYDIAGRYGGDEFIIILLDTNLEHAVYVAEILRKVIQNTKIIHQENEISISSSFGISSLKDNAEFIEKNLNIKNLESIYEIKNTDTINWEKIEKSKLEISALLLKMADMSLYRAKHTTCMKCGFGSEKNQLFAENKCPNCGGSELNAGRNKVEAFQE